MYIISYFYLKYKNLLTKPKNSFIIKQMGLFSKKRERQTTRKLNPDQEEKKSELKRKKFLADEYIELAKKDPDIKRQMIAQEFKLKFPETDPLTMRKREIDTRITEEALKIIDSDPELKEQFAQQKVWEIIGESRPRRSKGTPEYTGSSSVEEIIDGYKTLEQEFGGKEGGGLKEFLNKEFGVELLKTIQALTGKPVSEPTVIVQIDNEVREITKTEYQQLLQQGRIKPVGILEAPKAEAPKIPEEITSFIDLKQLSEMLSLSPQEFVDTLKYSVQQEDERSKFLWGFLSNTEVDVVVKLLSPYVSNKEVGESVKKLISDDGKKWLTEVISLIKEKPSA